MTLRTLSFALLTLAVLALAGTRLTAQEQPTRIVFIDSQRLIAAHPAGQEAARLQEQARQEIDALRADIEPIVRKAQAGLEVTPDERALYDTLVRSLEAVQQRWLDDIAAASQPALQAVDNAIRALATERGFAIVLDGRVAAESGLVVYAQDNLDITQQVLERIR